jgi:hypothetical protein
MPIKELLGDVTAVNTDLGLDVGKWATGSWVSGSQTVFTGTAAFTVLFAFLKVTAAAAGLATMKNGSNVMLTISTTAAFVASNQGNQSTSSTVPGVVTSDSTTMFDVAAGSTIVITAAGSTAGKYFFHYIKTPT